MNPDRLDPSVARWAALRTAARWEKALADLLAGAGVPVFLPQMTKIDSRARTSRSPLFAGYVFCGEREFLDDPRVLPAARAKVAQVLRPPDPERLREELAACRRAQEAVAIRIAEAARERATVQGRLDLLQDVRESYAGYYQGVRAVLAAARPPPDAESAARGRAAVAAFARPRVAAPVGALPTKVSE